MGTYTVYNAASVASTIQESLVKESVGDLITNLFPLDTPLQQILEKVPMNHVFHEQPVDTFSDITRTNAVLIANSGGADQFQRTEGATYTSGTPQYAARFKSCVAEIQGKQFSVSDTDRAMSQYGMVDRFAYEALKTTETVVNNFEHSFWWSYGSPPQGKDFDSGGGTVVARQTQGLCHWILKTGLQRSTHSSSPTSFLDGHENNWGSGGGTAMLNARSWAYNAGGLVLDDTMFKDNLMAEWYNLTGRQAGAVGFCGPKIKNLISRFALTANGPVNDRSLAAAAKRIVDTVDYYETDFGVVSLNLCRYLSISDSVGIVNKSSGDSEATITVPYNEVLLFIKPEYFKIGVVRPIYMSAIAKTGDFESGLIRGEMGLMCRNPSAGAAIVNCIP